MLNAMATERPLFAIPLKDLDAGPKQVRGAIPVEWLKKRLIEDALKTDTEAVDASKEGAIDVRLTPAGGDNVLVQGHVRATIDTTCGRCLGPASVPIDGELSLLMVPKEGAAKRAPRGRKSKESEGEFEFDPQEADVATYDGETLVLDELVREAILLELPISPLCSETCAGMHADPSVAAILGKARVDPRLAKLAELRGKVKDSPEK